MNPPSAPVTVPRSSSTTMTWAAASGAPALSVTVPRRPSAGAWSVEATSKARTKLRTIITSRREDAGAELRPRDHPLNIRNPGPRRSLPRRSPAVDQTKGGGSPRRPSSLAPPRRKLPATSDYWHFGSPSLLAGAFAVEPMKIAQVLVVLAFEIDAVQPSADSAITGVVLPLVTAYAVPRLVEYFTESAKYASSAVTRLRRSDFMDAMYAFSFVFANFGIAIAARMPMITTTIRSSIRVKPLRFIATSSEGK